MTANKVICSRLKKPRCLKAISSIFAIWYLHRQRRVLPIAWAVSKTSSAVALVACRYPEESLLSLACPGTGTVAGRDAGGEITGSPKSGCGYSARWLQQRDGSSSVQGTALGSGGGSAWSRRRCDVLYSSLT